MLILGRRKKGMIYCIGNFLGIKGCVNKSGEIKVRMRPKKHLDKEDSRLGLFEESV